MEFDPNLIVAAMTFGMLATLAVGYLYAANRARGKRDELVKAELDELRERTRDETRAHVEQTLRADLEESVKAELRERFEKQAKEDTELESKRARNRANAEADRIVKDSESKALDILKDAKREAEKEARTARVDLTELEKRLASREEQLDGRRDKIVSREKDVEKQDKAHEGLKADLLKREKALTNQEGELQAQLSRVAGLSADEAKNELIERVTDVAKIEADRVSRQIEEEAVEHADRRAKKIIGIAVQRWAGEYVAERCVNVVPIPSDELKGRIIGREGRNIRAIEAATGADLIIDDTPEAVMVSCFDPVRREVASLTLKKLVSDGRIHPSRIEEVVEKTQAEVDREIKERGERACFELGLHKVHADIQNLIGRLRYRTSYGQNQWSHSIEVGFLCGLMAAELGLNVKVARRCGLMHDIGKALTHEREGSHALIGAEIADRCGESEIVRNAIAAHHNDEPQNSVYAHLVIAGDALSGARPGARREILETYVQRLRDLERISSEFAGVEKSYAIQAGREIRVMVKNSKVNDDQAFALSKDIARKIESELTYPGQIKVCVIRETRAVDFAK